ncbi:MAG TPA: UDP-N-acetylglucosamine 1-carboxyvinyltransferase [Candidatus Pacearchaeota archaeon]|nr:UDP-N-acetylglucosamine 1-carboxyvinyltransferase [Candidatus Parcubacteria bacterium]HNZ83707.1 UDP-N-acetylglucosamine 1-carboxyvinyltransferase [Candidatus Pacearchaeota archaeon]HPM08357.1 UDP-N-acetylglucosamine 1-carboxyvinyltransferase [Candidatus Pacearchaeota archaeon]
MDEKFQINGPSKISGEIDVRGAKNVAFPAIIASILTEDDCVIDNLPLIEDVFRIIEILESMGARIDWISKRKIKINTKNIDPEKLNQKLVKKIRGSIYLFGALLARFKKASLPFPGGCVIGARPISTHLNALKQLGVEIKEDFDIFHLSSDQVKGGNVVLNEFSVSATVNTLIFASLIPGETIIKIADQDYQTLEMIKILNRMGIKAKLYPRNIIKITGAKKLGGFKYKLIPDPIEAGTFILMCAITKGNLLVKGVEFDYLELLLKRLKDFGLDWQRKGKNAIQVVPWDSMEIDKVQALIAPGIGTDILPLIGVLSTQLPGLTLLHDPLFEGRLKYLEELNKMGANIIFSDPHRAIISGPTPLYGVEIKSPDLRGGASLIAAGVVAKGQTTISNIYEIDRGYEKIDERLRKIGVDIQRIKG